MEAGSFEPLYCSVEIVNVAKKQRLSERFYFHLNGYDVLNDFLEDFETKRRYLQFQVRFFFILALNNLHFLEGRIPAKSNLHTHS